MKMWKITNEAENAEILLYDAIADFDSEQWGYVSAKGLINKIKSLGKIQNITLRINSVGGDVFQAQAMYNYLKTHPANVTVRVDGLAASAASLVAMAGDKIIMPENSFMMIHNPSGGAVGEADDLRDVADILDKIRDMIVNAYALRTGQSREDLISMMNEEKWLTADEAFSLKFCDEIEKSIPITAMSTKTGEFICKSVFGSACLDLAMSEKLPKIFKQESKNKMPEATTPTVLKIENVTDLEKHYPNLVAEIKNAAMQAERERLNALDALNAPGREAIISKAKYEEPRDARDIAIELLKADANKSELDARLKDAEAINPVLPPQHNPTPKDEKETAINAVVDEINRMRGYK